MNETMARWTVTTADTEEFLAVAGEHPRAEPARHSVVRLVYRPVEDRAILSFAEARRESRFTRERTRGLCPADRR